MTAASTAAMAAMTPSIQNRPSASPALAEYRVGGEFDVAAVVAGVMRFCACHHFHALFAAHVATAASELANNLWLYAHHGGVVRVRLLTDTESAGVELVAEDDGPGIADLAQALREGYSSGGGMGCGLPGVQRLMDALQIDTGPGRGTRVVARKWQLRRG